MNTHSSTDASMPSLRSSSKNQRSDSDMQAVARRQQWQDAFFHRLTQFFSLLVLFALVGIIVSLFVNAWPTFKTFGLGFIWTVEWDIVNEQYGAAIAIEQYVLQIN